VNPVRSNSVFRYFLPGDAFIRILLRDSGAEELRVKPGLNRAGYQRMVIRACCPDFRGDLAEALRELCPHDPLATEDLLYQLCIEVNPQLDIHTVRLNGEGEEPSKPEPSGQEAEGNGLEAALQRLKARSHGIEKRLGRHIIGQDQALEAVTRVLRKAAAGLAREGRPLGTFLFVGRTGTGKTELARSLAREIFAGGPSSGLVRIDCTEFALAHEYSKLIGAPPGYVGHEHGGFLTDSVRKNPECVVLFDEIEKAHPRMHNLLLQVLDDGRLTDSRGRSVDFSRTLVVLTSNVGAHEMVAASNQLGFGNPGARTKLLGEGTLKEITGRALAQQFSPEFLGRIGESILFRELTLADARTIATHMLTELCLRARGRGMRVACSPAVAKWVANKGFSPESGARELGRIIDREIEDPLAQILLSGRVKRRNLVRVSIRRGEPALTVQE
jgi:ATP-dependent Clp protease ATP-binding subunit ClpC